MFFYKSLVASALVLALSLQVSAHAAVAPALGVAGTPVRKDVQRPKAKTPCGKVDVAENLDTSTAIAMTGNSFSADITNFNAGKDGSRQVTAQVDPTGTGDNFVAATVTQNGDLAPPTTGTQQLTIEMPAGTTCTGGAAGNLCLMSFVTAGKFGNCVVVSQSADNSTATATDAANSTDVASATDAASTAAAAAASTTAAADRRAIGSRAARAFRFGRD